MTATVQGALPDLFSPPEGPPVRTPGDWPAARKRWLETIVPLEYGALPPALPVAAQLLHQHEIHHWNGVQHRSVRLLMEHAGQRAQFVLHLFLPPAEGPFPVVLTGDGCWNYLTDLVREEILRRGYGLAEFNRVELAPDVYSEARDQGLYPLFPEMDFGALSAWAWGYHRAVDYLCTVPEVDESRIAIVGHSRGGKTVLLAGATDERIALTAPNDSGSGGAGCYRWQGPESETLADTMEQIAYWFSPGLKGYVGREEDLPFDQHVLKALVAPRGLLSTEAYGDLWANPQGTWQTHRAAREVFRFLGAETQLGIWYRGGRHRHDWRDWMAFLAFADWCFTGQEPPWSFSDDPFPELPPAHSWTAP